METMEFVQTYETTISDTTGQHSATILVIPARSLGRELLDLNEFDLEAVASKIFGGEAVLSTSLGFDYIRSLYGVLGDQETHKEEISFAVEVEDPQRYQFAVYVLNARIIPFEGSPLSAESLASIATGAVKAGTITLGTTVGFFAAHDAPPLLLITVPLGIVLCGASVSFAKWLEENRKPIWNRLLLQRERRPANSPRV